MITRAGKRLPLQAIKHNQEEEISDRSCSRTSSTLSPQKSKKRPASAREGLPLSPEMPEKRDKTDIGSSSESEEDMDYNAQRERNIRDNQAFFSSLGIQEAKDRLSNRSHTPKKRVFKKKPPPPLVRRKSLRIQRIDPSNVALPPEPEPEPAVDEHPRIPSGPLSMAEARVDEEEDASFLSGCVFNPAASSQPITSDLSRFVSELKQMRVRRKAKVCRDRLFSVAVHPTAHKPLAMAGDKWGQLGFWNMSASDPQAGVVTYKPHSRPIGHIMVPTTHPHHVYTCSYDCTLRCCDLHKGLFQEVYTVAAEEDDLFRCFDFTSPSTMLLAQYRGDVALLDIRTPSAKAENQFEVCDKFLRTVSVHPTDSNFFCTAGTDMLVKVWDLRKLSKKGSKPLHALQHGRSVSSAYFSPLTGKHILSCSVDDSLNVYNSDSSCANVSRHKTISHNNKTGRWLTPFRAVWHAAREDVFFVGSMKFPRRIEAYDVNGQLLHELQGEVLASICSVLHFHPTRNILVGGNSSGYVFPFM